MPVSILGAAADEIKDLPEKEQAALRNAILKLAALGERLGYPHASAVKSSGTGLRELRPRAGKSRWRAFYRRVGDDDVVLAVGPEAQVDKAGFAKAVQRAESRLAALEANSDD